MSRSEEGSPPHLRYVVQLKGEFLSHRRNNGVGSSVQDWDSFAHARMWVRRADAERLSRTYSKSVVLSVTCALGEPFALFME